MEKMEALMYLGAGRFEWQERPAPVIEQDGDLVVRPFGVSTCDLDIVLARSGLDALGTGYVVGHEWIAEVIECADDISVHRPGDHVVIPLQVSCGACRTCRRGRTAACARMGPFDVFGLPGGSQRWGGAMSDLVRIPHANHLAFPAPLSLGAAAAGLSDNVSDGWRTIGPYVDEIDGPVLVGGYASIGLYAVLFGVAAGLEVHYRDDDPERLARAESLGALIIDTPLQTATIDKYELTINTAGRPDTLRAALESTIDGGTCVTTGMHMSPARTPLPLFDLYLRSITLVNETIQARANLAPLAEMIEAHNIDIAQLTDRTVDWTDAAEAWTGLGDKLLFTRPTMAMKTDGARS